MNEKRKEDIKMSHITTRLQMGDSAYIAKLLYEKIALEKRMDRADTILQAINFCDICSYIHPMTRAEVNLDLWRYLRDVRGVDYANGKDCYLKDQITKPDSFENLFPAKSPEKDPVWPVNPENKAFHDLALGKITKSTCPCERCERKHRPEPSLGPHFFTMCPICGNKRCPKGTDHDLECTGSNEPGQKGSSWENYPAFPGSERWLKIHGAGPKFKKCENGNCECQKYEKMPGSGQQFDPSGNIAAAKKIVDELDEKRMEKAMDELAKNPPRKCSDVPIGQHDQCYCEPEPQLPSIQSEHDFPILSSKPVFPPNRYLYEGRFRNCFMPLKPGQKRGFWRWLFGVKD